MRRSFAVLLAGAALLLPATAHGQRYVYTTICGACYNPGPVNQLHDDGLHGDGTAGDGVLGAYIMVEADRPPGYPHLWYTAQSIPWAGPRPACICDGGTPSNAYLHDAHIGDVIHFVDGIPVTNGWQGLGIASDHGMPTGAQLEVIVDSPTGTGLPAQRQGTVWRAVGPVEQAGTHRFYFQRSNPGPFVLFGTQYNSMCCFPNLDETPRALFTTSQPNTAMTFEFDEATGLLRATIGGPTAEIGRAHV